MKEIKLCTFKTLEEKTPKGFLIKGLDLVVVRYGKKHPSYTEDVCIEEH